jgi:hypothetical protein
MIFRWFLSAALIGGASVSLAHAGHHTHAVPIREGAAAQHRPDQAKAPRHWLAGDHHVHSEFSVDWRPDPAHPEAPPEPILGGDAIHPIVQNAQMAQHFGLSWMVSTDHGGPNHSKVNAELAYPELQRARAQTPGLVLFYGMEFDTPGADHSSLILPHSADERDVLRALESRFSKREPWPENPGWDSEPRMIEALRAMRAIPAPPVVIANHPSRSATAVGAYGQDRPGELRDWNDTAPNIAIGMEGAPGHQASALDRDGSVKPGGHRGSYRQAPTMGGFDQMTARLGGFWDSMLGEGRRFWVTATSDSHRHFSEGGSDFWPGEYSKTYVLARATHEDVLDGLRKGRVFVSTGDLITELDLTASAGHFKAGLGETLRVRKGSDIMISLRLRDPVAANAAGRRPEVARIDLIAGDVTGPVVDRATDSHPSTRILRRFAGQDVRRDGEYLTVSYRLTNVRSPLYVRVRGTNGGELEPMADPAGEDPWSDLWFYSNPVFVSVE